MLHPLSIALGLVLKAQKERYQKLHAMPQAEVNRCAATALVLQGSSLRMLESGYPLSDNVARRILASPIYAVNASRFSLVMSIIHIMGREYADLRHYARSVAKALSFYDSDRDICHLLTLSQQIGNRCCNRAIRHRIEYGSLLEALYNYMSEAPYMPSIRPHYHAAFARFDDLHHVYEMEKRLFPDQYFPFESFEGTWKRYPHCITMLYRDESKTHYVGHFKLYPMKQERVSQYLRGNAPPVTAPEWGLTTSFKQAYGMFIGVIANAPTYSSGLVLTEMLIHIRSLLSSPHLNFVLTRVRSPEGQALINKFGFEPIAGTDVHVLAITKSQLTKYAIDPILSYD